MAGHGAGIRTEAGGRITDLAKITPLRHRRADYVLVDHWHDANREIACNSAADLKKADRRILRYRAVPGREFDHVFYTGTNRQHVINHAGDAAGGIDISKRRVFPARHEKWEILVRSGDHPTVSSVDLVKLFQAAFAQNPVKELVRKSSLFAF